MLVTTVLVTTVLVAACSGGSDDEVSSATGSAVATTTLPDPAGTAVQPDGTSVDPGPPPASVLPPPVTVEGTPAVATVCVSLGDTLAVSDLLPRDVDSWPDERQRVVVDARRDAALYARAAETAPPTLAGPLLALGEFADFVADTVQEAPDAVSARASIDAYPAQGEVGAAASEVDRWKRANCP